ncbi:hypothetical protein UFOVP328_380 [uncultured Caudovirales phage]|uniref:Uncharacterized protein n=1 Tax=uncultured Caudovirales phage TaxID=2100421 RepID=A0A6J5LYN6_9CAUD|nr:hypothetical protein UFOVP328_380 [uncultured Caudovirales phage]
MNIIFGKENLPEVDEKYTVLELDTFRILPVQQLVTAYCLVENIPIQNLPKVESMRDLHENLLINYRKRDWNYCEQALEHLVGFWGSEMDTYYTTLIQRIAKYSEQDPGELFDGIIEKTARSQ